MAPVRTVRVKPAMWPLAVLVPALLIGLSASQASAARPTACRVDKAAYAALTVGMTEAAVRRALGCEGRRISHLTIGRVHRTIVSVPARGTYGANVTLTFRNGLLTDKSQLGLR